MTRGGAWDGSEDATSASGTESAQRMNVQGTSLVMKKGFASQRHESGMSTALRKTAPTNNGDSWKIWLADCKVNRDRDKILISPASRECLAIDLTPAAITS